MCALTHSISPCDTLPRLAANLPEQVWQWEWVMNEVSGAVKLKPRKYVEKIGDREWELEEIELDVHDDVILWEGNPRLQRYLPGGAVSSQPKMEAALQGSAGYATLLKSMDDLGQMEPIYVWRPDDSAKALVLEGATRVTILRQLDRKYVTGIKEGKFRRVKAKLLPAEFSDRERAILLARIHVRGSGVRDWGRYVEAKFVHEVVVGKDGAAPLMNVTQMAAYMERSVSWVLRLKDAYVFALAYVRYVDEEEGEGERVAADRFSILEEMSKARTIGTMLKDYNNSNYESLRTDVFDMVRNEAFKEYRDARFLKEFHDDPEKWEQLKSGEKHVASRLALEIKSNTSSVKARIGSLGQQVRRSLDRDEGDLGEEEAALLYRAAAQIEEHLMPDIRPFRVALRKFTTALTEASMADMKALDPGEVGEFREALEYFDQLYAKHGKAA